MKIPSVGATLFHANGQPETGRTDGQIHVEGNSRFSQFYERACRRTHFIYVAVCIYTYIKQGDYECTEIPIGDDPLLGH